MLTKLIASRFAGPILMALAALALAGGIFGGVQTWRLGNSQELASSRGETIKSLGNEIVGLRSSIGQRDSLIASQNAGIEAISKVRAEDRTVYIKQYAAADERAKGDDARADQLLSLQSDTIDELAQCRASKIILEEEVGQ